MVSGVWRGPGADWCKRPLAAPPVAAMMQARWGRKNVNIPHMFRECAGTLEGNAMREGDTGLLSDHLLARLSERGDVRTYPRGTVLIQEGERSDALYILLSGELKVYTVDAREREFVYNTLKAGEFFGELFLDGGARSASVRAVTTALCVMVDRDVETVCATVTATSRVMLPVVARMVAAPFVSAVATPVLASI